MNMQMGNKMISAELTFQRLEYGIITSFNTLG